MAQFSVVIGELRKWFQQFKWFSIFEVFQLQLLFGSIGFLFLVQILYQILPISSYNALSTIFYTIPLVSIARLLFFVGVWIMLVSEVNMKYLPYGLWLYAVQVLFPFTNMSLSLLVSVTPYIYLGYAMFKYSASAYVNSKHSIDR